MATTFDTVGIIGPGEMGCAVAAALRGSGVRVVTTLAGRGGDTVQRCRASGIEVLDAMTEVVRAADCTISLVPPAAAEAVAAEYCRSAGTAPPNAVYLDLNSVRPELAMTMAERVEAAGRAFVDGAINGLAKNLTSTATLYLSGARATEVASRFDGVMRVRVLGGRPGRASALKMLLAGLAKGTCALFTELAIVAHRQGMLAEMLAASSEVYPGIVAVVERMAPTYENHAGRRATEMAELAATARAAGIKPCVIDSVRRLHDGLAAASYAGGSTEASAIQTLVEQLAAEGFLSAPATSGPDAAID